MRTITIEEAQLTDLARAGVKLIDQGKHAELPKLLQRFSVTSLPDLPHEKYGEFAAALRELGGADTTLCVQEGGDNS